MTYRKLVATKLSSNFREATAIVTEAVPALQAGQVLVSNKFAGVNASDINYTNGKYLPGVKPPFDCGFESVGEIIQCGPETKMKAGQAVAVIGYGAFSELTAIDEKKVIPIPKALPNLLPVFVSGLTASIGLEAVGEMKSGETVLVTAAAGGTGMFAVQLAKLAGNTVIGTCSSDEKAAMLRRLGCDRVINYKSEDVHRVLRKEFPRGVDLVYECVGGSIFEACVSNLAVRGRLVVIGAVSGYADATFWGAQSEAATKPSMPLAARLLAKSASVRGFFLNHYTRDWKAHMAKLFDLIQAGKLESVVDSTPFVGLEAVADAVEHMYKGKNTGKVVVTIGAPRGRL